VAIVTAHDGAQLGGALGLFVASLMLFGFGALAIMRAFVHGLFARSKQLQEGIDGDD
jgi:hypothetical protein